MDSSLSRVTAGRQNGPQGLVEMTLKLLLFLGQRTSELSSALVGPLMGITSVLWLMMRNNAAISPKASWMVFCGWSFLTLAYLIVQCHRVSNHQLYVLFTVALSSLCMCIVAIAQKSTLQSGLVTAIPTCTSFAAYAVAYFFPERNTREVDPWGAAV